MVLSNINMFLELHGEATWKRQSWKRYSNRKVSWDPTCMVLGKKPRSANKRWAIYAMFRITQQVFKKNRDYKKTLCVECQNPNIRTAKIIEKKPLPWGYSNFYLIREGLVHERCVFWIVKISHQEYSVSFFFRVTIVERQEYEFN